MSHPPSEHLEHELVALRERYANLKLEKEELEIRYDELNRKWKQFKQWLFSMTEHSDAPTSSREVHARKLLGRSSVQQDAERSGTGVAFSFDEGLATPVSGRPLPSQDLNKKFVTDEHMFSMKNLNETGPSIPQQGEYTKPNFDQVANVGRRESTSINARFCLNPMLNDGLKYQYDEVIRHKRDRQILDADDCECCRDYYEAVGPVPPKAQPPLWRSPSPATPKKRKRVLKPEHDSHYSAESRSSKTSDANVADRMRAISRHRRRWEAPQTPPGYWDIGFPDTQETDRINQRARDIHAQKMRDVEAEAQ